MYENKVDLGDNDQERLQLGHFILMGQNFIRAANLQNIHVSIRGIYFDSHSSLLLISFDPFRYISTFATKQDDYSYYIQAAYIGKL